jgi:hypothetical protein
VQGVDFSARWDADLLFEAHDVLDDVAFPEAHHRLFALPDDYGDAFAFFCPSEVAYRLRAGEFLNAREKTLEELVDPVPLLIMGPAGCDVDEHAAPFVLARFRP